MLINFINGANKNDAVNNLGFKLIWSSLWMNGVAYECKVGCRITFPVTVKTIANQAWLKQKLDSISFLNKKCFSLICFLSWLLINDQIQFMFVCFFLTWN